MLVEGDARSPNETGGMLLGYKTTARDVEELVIVEVVARGRVRDITVTASTRTVRGSSNALRSATGPRVA
jgi:hypothetical protein